MRKFSSRKFAAIVLTVFFSMIIVSNYEIIKMTITGWATRPSLSVSIESKVDGKILLAYEPILNLGDKQYIFTEFINIGTEVYDAKIEIHVYYLNDTRLDRIASYYDSSVELYPGMRRGYAAVFRPGYGGVYYIKVKVPYAYRVAQTWGAFIVYGPGPVVTTTVTAPAAPAPPAEVPVAAALIECPDNVTVIEGESSAFGVTIKNIGESDLNNLRFYMSAPNILDIDINPKTRSLLKLNSSALFMVTVTASMGTPQGVYPLEIELTTDELRKGRDVDVFVVPSNVSQIEHIEILLSNYKYLIDKVSSEIYAAALEGYDVDNANESIEIAKASLELARMYLEAQDFDNTWKELRKVVKYLEDALLQLASAIMYEYRPPAFYPLLIILVEILIGIGIFIIFYLDRRRKRRPKSLEIPPGGRT